MTKNPTIEHQTIDNLTKGQRAVARALGHHGLFADPGSVEAAFEYGSRVAKASGDNQMHVTTAMHMLANAYAIHVGLNYVPAQVLDALKMLMSEADRSLDNRPELRKAIAEAHAVIHLVEVGA